MKILFIHNYYRITGGEENYINLLKKLLIKKKHEIIEFKKDNKEINNIFKKLKTSINLFYSREIEREISALIEQKKPDIAQFFNIFPLITPTAYFVCKKYDIPIVQRISSYKYLCPKSSLFRNGKICTQCVDIKIKYPSILNKCYANSLPASLFFSLSFFYHKEIIKSFNLVDVFYFPTKFIRDKYIKHSNIDVKKSFIIPNFTNIYIKNWKINILDKQIIPYLGKYFLFVGRLVEEKGIINLIQVFKVLKKQKLVIIGEGYLDKLLERESQSNNNIIYLKHQEWNNVLHYINFSKAVIIPSIWYDVFPNVFLEALFLDKPIILSNIPSLNFLKANGILKFKANDPVSLKRIIEKIIFNKIDINTSFNELKNKFSSEFHYKKLFKIYNKLVYGKKRK